MPHPLYVFFQVEIWVSWFIGLLCFLSAWLRRPSHFKSIGRSKLAWMVITALGLIPFVGIIPALVYFFRVYRYLPAKEGWFLNNLRDGARRGWDRGPTAPLVGSQPAGGERRCPNCAGRKTQNCRNCGGDYFGCWACKGGQVTCQICNGTGTVLARSRRG